MKFQKLRRLFHKCKWRIGALIMECKHSLPLLYCKGCDTYVLLHPRDLGRGHKLRSSPLDLLPMANGIVWENSENA